MNLPQGMSQAQFSKQISLLHKGEFHGDAYDPELDKIRLTSHRVNIFLLMMDGQWRTLEEIEDVYGYPQGSISSCLRSFRQDDLGGHTLEKRRKPEIDPHRGLWEYRLLLKLDPIEPEDKQFKLF